MNTDEFLDKALVLVGGDHRNLSETQLKRILEGFARKKVRHVLDLISKHPEYPEPCPMLHEVASKAADEMDKDWVMHMVRETCRQTKQAILSEIQIDQIQ